MKFRFCCVCRRQSKTVTPSSASLYRFPKDASLRLEWCKFASIENIDSVESDYYRICAKHFRKDDFVVKSTVMLNPRQKLKNDAIPSICNPVEDVDNDEKAVSMDHAYNLPCEKKQYTTTKKEKRLCLICGNINRDVSFYCFPVAPEERKKWADFCNLEISEVKNWHSLCEKHFTAGDFRNGIKRRLLQKTAVPSIRSVSVQDVTCDSTSPDKKNDSDVICLSGLTSNTILEETHSETVQNCQNSPNRVVNPPAVMENGKTITNGPRKNNVRLKCKCGSVYAIKVITGNVAKKATCESSVAVADIHTNPTILQQSARTPNRNEIESSGTSSATCAQLTPTNRSEKRPFPRYVFDFRTPDVDTPKRARLFLQKSRQTILELRRKNSSLQKRNNRLQKKISSVSDLFNELKRKNLRNSESADMIQKISKTLNFRL